MLQNAMNRREFLSITAAAAALALAPKAFALKNPCNP